MLYDIVDKNNNKIGISGNRHILDLLSKDLFVSAVRIWVKTCDDTVLFIQRLPEKLKDPLLWENPGALVPSGVSCIGKAISEIYEKTGILLDREQLVDYGNTMNGNCIVRTFGCKIDAPMIYLDSSKIANAEFVPISNIQESKEYITKNAWDNYITHEKAISSL